MKELQPDIPHPEKVSIVNQRQVDYEKKFLGSTKLYAGHKFFEINCDTGEITEAQYDEEKSVLKNTRCLITNAITGSTTIKVKEVITKENHLYIGALNKKSAHKKYLDWFVNNSIQQKRKNKL
jgi:hypothetical protein